MTATLKGAQPSVAGLVFTVKKLVEETQIELLVLNVINLLRP